MGTVGDVGLAPMLSVDSSNKVPPDSNQKGVVGARNASAVATGEHDTDKQMSQLFEEVNQMKAFMAQIRKGEVIGEIASQ